MHADQDRSIEDKTQRKTLAAAVMIVNGRFVMSRDVHGNVAMSAVTDRSLLSLSFAAATGIATRAEDWERTLTVRDRKRTVVYYRFKGEIVNFKPEFMAPGYWPATRAVGEVTSNPDNMWILPLLLNTHGATIDIP